MKVTIYGTPQCTFCMQAKDFCERHNIPYQYKTVGKDIQVEQLSEMVGQPVRTVPQIFINHDGFDEYIGNYNQLENKIKNMTI